MPVTSSTAYNTARTVTNLVRALLNDRGTLSIPVNIGVISRNIVNSTVTVTSLLPHNLVPQDFVLINNVPLGMLTFTGIFQVLTVNGLQFTYAQAGPTETAGTGLPVGTSQGFGIGGIWTDAVLMPYVNAAYRKVQRALSNIATGLFIQDDVLLIVPAVTTVDSSVQAVINDATPPPNQLPTDLITPSKIWERQSGSTDDFFEMVNLTDHGGLPSRPQGQTLGVWEWRVDGIYFIGATNDTQIRLRYRKALADLVDGTSTVLIRNAQEAISYFAAAAAGGSRGSPLAPQWVAAGDDAIDDLQNVQTKQMQFSNYRPKGFSRRRRMTSF